MTDFKDEYVFFGYRYDIELFFNPSTPAIASCVCVPIWLDLFSTSLMDRAYATLEKSLSLFVISNKVIGTFYVSRKVGGEGLFRMSTVFFLVICISL